MAFRKKYESNADIALKIIAEEINKGKIVYKVNVHSVGIEYRIYPLSLENIMGQHFTFRYYKEVNGRTRLHELKLSKKEYEIVEEVVEGYWVKHGERWQDRGLY